jgi:hypothetical protein
VEGGKKGEGERYLSEVAQIFCQCPSVSVQYFPLSERVRRMSSVRNISTVRTSSARNISAVRMSSARNTSTVRTSSVRNISTVRTSSVGERTCTVRTSSVGKIM